MTESTAESTQNLAEILQQNPLIALQQTSLQAEAKKAERKKGVDKMQPAEVESVLSRSY